MPIIDLPICGFIAAEQVLRKTANHARESRVAGKGPRQIFTHAYNFLTTANRHDRGKKLKTAAHITQTSLCSEMPFYHVYVFVAISLALNYVFRYFLKRYLGYERRPNYG